MTAPEPAAPPAFPMRRGCPFAPPEEYARLRREQPLARVTMPTGRGAWLATRYEDVRALLADPRVSAEARHAEFPAFSEAERQVAAQLRPFLRTDAPDHTRYRKMLQPEFTLRKARALRPAVQAIADELIDDMLALPGPVCFITHYANAFSTSVICALLGIPGENVEFFRDVTRISGSRTSTEDEVRAALGGLFELLSKIIELRREQPADDLISQLVTEQLVPGHMTHQELLSVLGITINGGRVSTTAMIALSTLHLLQRPELAEELRAQPALLPQAIEEFLRVTSVSDALPARVATADIELPSGTLPSGHGAIGLLAAANHDPEVFPEPEHIDIHRTPNRHLAFGHGPHQCIGQNVARLELEVALETLLRRVPTLRLATGVEEIEFMPDAHTYGVERMPVIW
ncbi:cytochrome P450 [Streptomyces sp. TS71-3]|uniref:cytochrome P450 n=1 Tax=Streptomyces sp. TS71-3 TaxID=2733862 RepID=UPI001B23C430|nr:cytochrome P450 [Streptomyces sp. TS71-3]GHJ35181.1 cytochrome P450 [Streptomyces sp. TS71-3]